MKKLIILSTLSSLSLSSVAAWTPYTIQSGDQLGKLVLAQKLNLPLWGAEGSVAKVFAKNQAGLTSADKIYVGQSILLPQTAADLENNSLASTKILKKEGRLEIQAVTVTQAATQKNEEVKSKENKKEEAYTPAKLSVGGAFSLMNFDLAQGGVSSNLKSEPIYGIAAEGEFPMSESFFLDLGFSYRKIKFKSPEGKTLTSDGGSFYSFSVGGVKHWDRVSLGFGAQLGQSPLAVQMNTTSIAMRTFQVFSPYLKTRVNFFKREKTKLSFELMGLYNVKSKTDRYNLTKGYNAVLSFDIQRSLSKDSSLSVVPFVNYGNKTLGSLTQKGTNSGLKVMYTISD